MSNPNPGGNVYKREGSDNHQAWNAVISHVNEERQNPPEDTDCEALGTIDEVEVDHVWTQQDVEDVRDAIDEMCPFSWSEDLTYWHDDIISEIEDALNRDYGGWGAEDECCEPSCVPPCSDYGEEEDENQYAPASSCAVFDYGYCTTDYIQWNDVVRPAAEAYIWQIASAVGQFNTYFMLYCNAVDQVETWQDKVDAQQEVVDEECAKPPPNDCAVEQAKLEEYQSQLDYWEGQRDTYESLKNDKSDEADSLATAQNNIILAASDPEKTNMWFMVSTTSHPWADLDCEEHHGLEGPQRCQWAWSFGFTLASEEDYSWRYFGFYTPSGIPYATYLSVNAPFHSPWCVLCCGPEEGPNICLWDYPGNRCYQAYIESEICDMIWTVHAYSQEDAAGDCDE